MLAQEQKSTYTVLSPDHKLSMHPKSDRILMIAKEAATPFTLCAAPENMKWIISKERQMNGELHDRADAGFVCCPDCGKLTNDFGHCTTKFGCYYF